MDVGDDNVGSGSSTYPMKNRISDTKDGSIQEEARTDHVGLGKKVHKTTCRESDWLEESS
jgi:hypothetical protein